MEARLFREEVLAWGFACGSPTPKGQGLDRMNAELVTHSLPRRRWQGPLSESLSLAKMVHVPEKSCGACRPWRGWPGPARYHITLGKLVMPQCGAQATPAVPSTVPGLSQVLAMGEGAASIISVLRAAEWRKTQEGKGHSTHVFQETSPSPPHSTLARTKSPGHTQVPGRLRQVVLF